MVEPADLAIRGEYKNYGISNKTSNSTLKSSNNITKKIGVMILDNEANYQYSLKFMHNILRKNLHLEETADARMGWLIIVGSLPIVVLGYLGQDAITTNFRSLWLIASVLIIFGVVLGVADKYGKSDKKNWCSNIWR